MSKTYNISHRHEHNINALPGDLTLKTTKGNEDVSIKVHRLVLAKSCGFFTRYFKDHSNVTEFTLPVDPDNKINDFLELLYNQRIKLTVDNAIPLLKIVDYYEAFAFIPIILNYIANIANSNCKDNFSIVMKFASTMIDNGIQKYANVLAAKLAHYFDLYYRSTDVNDEANLIRVYESCNDGRIFAQILLQLDLNSKSQLSEAEKATILDRFTLFARSNPLTAEEKEALSDNRIIDWANENSVQWILNYKCDWLASTKSRSLYKKVLDGRRAVANKFNQNVSKELSDKTKVSRWYTFSWITATAKCMNVNNVPEVNAVKFISTLGGLVDWVDPMKFGFINVSTNPKLPIVLKAYSEINTLRDDNSVFTVVQKPEKGSKITTLVDFNKCIFKSRALTVSLRYDGIVDPESIGKSRDVKKKQVPIPKMLAIGCSANKSSVKPKEIPTNEAIFGIENLVYDNTFDHLEISAPVTADFKNITYRLRYIDALGQFMP